jgi:hypothetical protein
LVELVVAPELKVVASLKVTLEGLEESVAVVTAVVTVVSLQV